MKILTIIFALFVSFVHANDSEVEFEKAWNNPMFTQIKLEDIAVNERLNQHYETSIPLSFTREMLWDVEVKKARNPMTYISYVVKEGNAWGQKILNNGDETFVRWSMQRQWLNRDIYEAVFEEVYLNHKEQKATFLGRKSLGGDLGQPLFHVQHSLIGGENNPLNVWRIVHLTKEYDQSLADYFQRFNDSKLLPGYVEKYITNDLNITFFHK